MFSLRFLRFLLFSILSVAVTTGSLLMLLPASAHAQGGVPLWTNRYNGPENLDDHARSIAVDSSGNVFVTGFAGNPSDYVTIAYSNAGVPLWTNRYDGSGNGGDYALAIAVDSSGNVFVMGHSDNGSSVDYATLAYSNVGVPLWTNRYDGPANRPEFASAIAVDNSGNVFVTGSSENSPFDSDYATVAYSNAGVPLWSNRYDGLGNTYDVATAIAVDSSGNVFVTGASYSGSDFQIRDYATVAYSNAGELLWTNFYNGPENGEDYATAIAVDTSGNVFVTGVSKAANGVPDYATVAYSSAGVPLWTNRYNGPGIGNDAPSAIAVDSSGNVFVTGRSEAAKNFPDYATVAYSNSGVPLWTNRYSGLGNYAVARAIAVDSSGNVFVTGDSWNGSNDDYVTIKYSSSVPPPRLDFELLSNQLVLSWTNAGFNLQSAPAITNTFTNLPAATSPYTNPITGPQQFFRLISK